MKFEIDGAVDLQLNCVGDGKRITQILVNLLSNAIKFTLQGAVRLSVTPDMQRSTILFVVEDSGIGMDVETVEKLFQPFEQGDSSISSRFGGTGLGLYISSNLAQLMEGTLSVESKLDKGSRFSLSLPLKMSTEKPLAVSNVEQGQVTQHCYGKVLLAEDAPELQILIKRMITPLGVEVDCVGNGQEAVERGQSGEYSLILMDMQMPVMDGIEATRQLRAQGCSTPVVALTANVMEQHRQQFSEAGCDDFLSKPVDRVKLKEVVDRFCDAGQAEDNG